jgi:hypothetical protein
VLPVARVSSALRVKNRFNTLHFASNRRALNEKRSQGSTGFGQRGSDCFHGILQGKGIEEHQQRVAGMKKIGPQSEWRPVPGNFD